MSEAIQIIQDISNRYFFYNSNSDRKAHDLMMNSFYFSFEDSSDECISYREIIEKYSQKFANSNFKIKETFQDKQYQIIQLKAQIQALLQQNQQLKDQLDQSNSIQTQTDQNEKKNIKRIENYNGERHKHVSEMIDMTKIMNIFDAEDIKNVSQTQSVPISNIENDKRYQDLKSENKHLKNVCSQYMNKLLKQQQDTSQKYEIQTQSTPRPSLKNFEKLVLQIDDKQDFNIDKYPSTQKKLDCVYERLGGLMNYYLINHQKKQERGCDACQFKISQKQYHQVDNINFQITLEIYSQYIQNYQNTSLFITLNEKKNIQWRQIGKTELQLFTETNNNINFQQNISVFYKFDEKQEIEIQLRDQKQILGRAPTQISRLVGENHLGCKKELVNKKGQIIGEVVIKTWSLGLQQLGNIFLEWQCQNLRNVKEEIWQKNDPFLVFYKQDGNELEKIIRTEFIHGNQNPSFKKFQVSLDDFCNNNEKLPIIARCYDWQQDEECILIGETQLTLEEMQKGKKEYQLSTQKFPKSGTMNLQGYTFQKASFIDYLVSGIQLNLMIAIDYTKSNGDPTEFTSLHHLSADFRNQYQMCVELISNLLLNYQHSKKVPCYGFGGKPKFPGYFNDQTQHCFHINGNPKDPLIEGFENISLAYKNSLKYVELSGPTKFVPLIKLATQQAQQFRNQGSQNYQILVLITDGEVHDQEQVINTLFESIKYPLSIIIVGVGNANFDKMDILDGDQGLYTYDGKKVQRDIVQFVQYRDFVGDNDELCKAFLEELPEQLVGYYDMINMEPLSDKK